MIGTLIFAEKRKDDKFRVRSRVVSEAVQAEI